MGMVSWVIKKGTKKGVSYVQKEKRLFGNLILNSKTELTFLVTDTSF